MLEQFHNVIRSLYQSRNDAMLEGEANELSQIHVLLIVVSPVKLILCSIEFIHVSHRCLVLLEYPGYFLALYKLRYLCILFNNSCFEFLSIAFYVTFHGILHPGLMILLLLLDLLATFLELGTVLGDLVKLSD